MTKFYTIIEIKGANLLRHGCFDTEEAAEKAIKDSTLAGLFFITTIYLKHPPEPKEEEEETGNRQPWEDSRVNNE